MFSRFKKDKPISRSQPSIRDVLFGDESLEKYAHHSARYFNFSGAGVVWDVSDQESDRIIDGLLAVGQGIIS